MAAEPRLSPRERVGTHPRGGPAGRLPERAGGDRHRRQSAADRAARPHRVAAAGGHVLRARRRDPAARRRPRGAGSHRRPRARRAVRADPQRAGPGQRAGAARPLPRDQRLPVRHRVAQPGQRQPLRGGVAVGPGAGAGPRPRGGPALRGRDLRRLRLPLRGPRGAGPGVRDRPPAGRRGRAGGRLRRHHRDGQPGAGAGVLPRGAGRARRRGGADRALPQHARAGPRQRPGRARRRRPLLRIQLRRAGGLPRAGRRDRQRRHGRRPVHAPRDGHRDRRVAREAARGLARGTGGARPPARLAPPDRRPRGVERLADLTTLKLGGPAARVVEATTEGELAEMVRSAYEPLLVLAGGSNVVIADAGFPGTVVRVLTRGVERDGPRIAVQAGEPWDDLVADCVARGLQGFECLSGIPGSTGATPIQNVGAYGQEVSETVESVRVLDRASGQIVEMPAAECGFAYRASRFKHRDRHVVLAVPFVLREDERPGPLRYAELARRLDVPVGGTAPLEEVREAVLELRRGKGMVIDPADPDTVSAGSFFTNPILEPEAFATLAQRVGPDLRPPAWPEPDGRVKTSAAWLIERAGFGCGYGDGRVGISSKHTLALINRGDARTSDLMAL